MENRKLEEVIEPRLYISNETDPVKNLSYEEYLLDILHEDQFFFLMYVNTDSVVLGRHQNPWLECPVQHLKKEKILLVRRVSGGGTVYHDTGNVNFSFIMGKSCFDKTRNLSFILRALERLGISGSLSERGDIIVQGKKVSGNAQCFRRGKALHHGTLLVNANLRRLETSLKVLMRNISTHAVASNPHPVANLVEFRSDLSTLSVIDAITSQFYEEFSGAEVIRIKEFPKHLEERYIRNTSWEWVYGKTPRFSAHLVYRISGGEFSLDADVENGNIRKAVLRGPSGELNISDQLEGIPFSSGPIAERLSRTGKPEFTELSHCIIAEDF